MIKCRSLTLYITSALTSWDLSIYIFKSALPVSDVVLVLRVPLSEIISPSVCSYQRLLRGQGWTRILGLTDLSLLLHFFYHHCRTPLPVVRHFKGSPGKISISKVFERILFEKKRRIEIIILYSFQIGWITTLRICGGMLAWYLAIFLSSPVYAKSFLLLI